MRSYIINAFENINFYKFFYKIRGLNERSQGESLVIASEKYSRLLYLILKKLLCRLFLKINLKRNKAHDLVSLEKYSVKIQDFCADSP